MLACREVFRKGFLYTGTEYYFYPQNATFEGRWVKLNIRYPLNCQQKREEFCRKKAEIIKKFAKDGLLDFCFTKEEVNIAKKKGRLPPNYNLHHMVPLNLGGSNEIQNICVIDNRLHVILHSKQLDLIMFTCQGKWSDIWSRSAYLYVPKDRCVVTMDNADMFFTLEEWAQMRNEFSILKRIKEQRLIRQAETKKEKLKRMKLAKMSALEVITPEMMKERNRMYRYEKRKLEKEEMYKNLQQMPKKETTYRDSDKFHRSFIKRMRDLKSYQNE